VTAVEKRKLTQVGLAAVERLDLPGQLAAGMPQLELVGNAELYLAHHRGVLSYSTELVEINGGGLIVRLSGKQLQIIAMTEEELRVAGRITALELVDISH